MKKILFAVMAVATFCFTSCGNKTQQGEAIDSVAVMDSLAQDEANGVIDALKAAIDSKDASLLNDILAQTKEKAAELVKQNPELAKQYIAKVQNFVKENETAIKEAFAGNAAAAAAVNALTSDEAADGLSSAIDKLVSDAEDVKAAAKDAAKKQVETAENTAKEKVQEQKEAAKEKANKAIDDAANKATSNVKKSLGL